MALILRFHAQVALQREIFYKNIFELTSVNKPLSLYTHFFKIPSISVARRESLKISGGVLHCFIEDSQKLVGQYITSSWNVYLFPSGIVTFKASRNKCAVWTVRLSAPPLDRILLHRVHQSPLI